MGWLLWVGCYGACIMGWFLWVGCNRFAKIGLLLWEAAVNIMLMRRAPLVGRAGVVSEGRASEGRKKEKKCPACVQYHTK